MADPAGQRQVAADPAKLLESWMQWERGEIPPGRTLANMKIAGLRSVLEVLAAQALVVEKGEEPPPPSPR